jgi:hypothetical protein
MTSSGTSSPDTVAQLQPPQQSRNDTDMLALEMMLSYSEMSVGRNGSVLNRSEKATLRERHGFCLECEGQPVQLYNVRKSRMNPLWVTKDPRTVDGVCADGVCYACHPSRDPNRKERRRQRRSSSLRHLQTLQLPRLQQTLPRIDDGPTAIVTAVVTTATAAASNSNSISHPRSSLPATSPRTSDASITVSSSALNGSFAVAASDSRRESEFISTSSLPTLEATLNSSSSSRRSSGNSQSQQLQQRKIPPQHPAPARQQQQQQQQNQVQQHQSPARLSRRMPSFRNIYIPEEISPVPEVMIEAAMGSTPYESDLSMLNFTDGDENHGMDSQIERLGSFVKCEGSFDTAGSQENAGIVDSAAVATCGTNTTGATYRTPLVEFPSWQLEERETLTYTTPNSTPDKKKPASGSKVMTDEDIEVIIKDVDSLVGDMQSDGDGLASAQFLTEIVLGTMKEHQSVLAIQFFCLKTIYRICKGDSNDCSTLDSSKKNVDNHYQKAIMEAGGSEYIVKAMSKFPESMDIQEQGCGAMWSLGVSAKNRLDLIRAGACMMVYNALANFLSHESLVATAIGTMRTLSPELEARDAFKTMDTSKLAVQGMVMHPSSIAIQRDACALLSNLAVDIERQAVAAVSREEMQAIVNAMNNHRDALSVIQGACFALKNYSHEETNCRTLRHCKNAEDLLIHISVFPQASVTCQADAADILERVQLSNTMDESMEDQAVDAFLQELSDIQQEEVELSTSPSSSSINNEMQQKQLKVIFQFLLAHHDWSPRLVARGLKTLRKLVTGKKELDLLLKGNTTATSRDGAFAAILGYCRLWRDHESVCIEACSLVAILSQDLDLHTQVLNLGWVEFIVDALVSFKEDESLVRSVLEALKAVSTTNTDECMDLVRKELPTFMEAIALHEENETVQVFGVELVSMAY